MKIPKKTKKYCPHCKKHVEHKVIQEKTGRERGKLTIGARRHSRRSNIKGYGGFPQPQMQKGKKYGVKKSKKVKLVFECSECKKKQIIGSGRRAKKVEFKQEH